MENITIVENREIVREVSLTVPKEWGIHGTEDGGGTFAIAIRECTPHRMEALAEALKRLGVIGCQETTIFVLSPEWEIDYTAHTGEGTLTLKKYKHEYEYHEN